MVVGQADTRQRLYMAELLMDTLDAIWASSAPDAEKRALGMHAVTHSMARLVTEEIPLSHQRVPSTDAALARSSTSITKSSDLGGRNSHDLLAHLHSAVANTLSCSSAWASGSEASCEEDIESERRREALFRNCIGTAEAPATTDSIEGQSASCTRGTYLSVGEEESRQSTSSKLKALAGSAAESDVMAVLPCFCQAMQRIGQDLDREFANMRAQSIKVCTRCKTPKAGKYFTAPQWRHEYGTCRWCADYWDGFDYLK